MCAALGARAFLRRHQVADADFNIVIAERNDRLGIKIRVSGGGKCNITHSGEMMNVLDQGFFRLNEQRFLKPSFYGLDNQTVLQWLADKGVETYTRPNGRVFPTSGKATDVLEAFEARLAEHSIRVLLNARAKQVERVFSESDNPEPRFLIGFEDGAIRARFLLIATGGVSYSKTGTTGDGLRFAKSLGHTIVKPLGALAPIYFKSKPPQDLIGVSFRSIGLIAKSQSVEVKRRDDVLMTHLGISGPAALSISRDVAEMLENESVWLYLDFFSDDSDEALESKFISFQSERATQFARTFFESRLPDAIVPHLFKQSDLALGQKWHNLSKAQRKRLVDCSKKFFLAEAKEAPIERGEVSAGGVSLKEVNPKTMQSRRLPNLYFAGETLDIAGEVGGFNLQAAYSTGWSAGIAVATAFYNQARTSEK
jgi:predicted Rossmann fold flavoprotein